jgi:3-hydroxyisobutyrate dehydrogenase
MSKSSVGLIGAGLLGQSIAHCLLRSNEAVIGFDIDQQRCLELAEQGAQTVASAADVCQQCRTIFLSLPDSTVVAEVIERIRSKLQSGDIVIDTTTGNPRDTRHTCQLLAAGGISYLDATIVGSSVQVRSREGLMLIGGDASAVSNCQSLLDTISDHALHLGPSGSGATMKLVVNLVLGLNRAVLAEGLSLGEACGLETEQVLAVLRQSPAYASVMDTKGLKMILGDFSPQARLAQHLKDVQLILQLGNEHSQSLSLSKVHQSLLEHAVELGYADADNSAVIMASRSKATLE